MRDRGPWIVWLVVLVLLVAGFAFRHSLYTWLLRLHGVHS